MTKQISAGHLNHSAYSSPAIARRRRGRPPKSHALAKYTNEMAYISPSPSPAHNMSGLPGSGEPKTPTPRGRPRGARGRSRLGHSSHIPASGSQEIPTTDDAAANTAEQYILSHLAQHNAEGGSPRADISSFADLLPSTSLDSHVDPSLAEPGQSAEDASTQINTPSVLSRLKKGLPGSCDICGRTETSVWRKLTLGGEDHKVCNGPYLLVFASKPS